MSFDYGNFDAEIKIYPPAWKQLLQADPYKKCSKLEKSRSTNIRPLIPLFIILGSIGLRFFD